MRTSSVRSLMINTACAVSKALGIALLLGSSAQAQNAATVYAWSAYPNAETTLLFTTGVAVDGAGNVYASLLSDHRVVRIAPSGEVTALAGSPGLSGAADGTGTDARFSSPQGVAVDGFGTLFVADFGNSTIRKVTSGGAVVTLSGFAGSRGRIDGPPAIARFNAPRGVVLDTIGDLYVTDSVNGAIRLITLDNHVQTVAGGTPGTRDAVGTVAQFMMPWGITLDQAGNLYVTDAIANTVRKLSAIGRVSTTIAGTAGVEGSVDGTGAAARFNQPTGITVDAAGTLVLTDSQNHTIRRIGTDGQVTTIGGRADAPGAAVDGIGAEARFLAPYAVAVTGTGIIYVADYLGIRRGEPVRAPVIAAQPTGLTARENTRVSLTVVANGAPAPTYQWRLNGVAVAGATQATLTFGPVRAEQAGDYTVVVTNSLGSVTSSVATLVVNYPPKISVAPQATVVGSDGTARLSVTVTGPGPIAYQWLRNGDPVAGATNATFATGVYGNYSVAVTNAFGTSTTGAAPVRFPNRLVNLSTSGVLGGGTASLVTGFVVTAPAGETKRLLIRAVGPSLGKFGVPDALPQPTVALLDQRGAVLARNTGWATNPLSVYSEIDYTSQLVGAFALA
ncbi:MAG: immunoglobulin domain-containing protein, partial [Verrucomicrobia bacterium]|nr:immunoglobulin domain-containing protein [Verrucomicrobiota bacterium]